QTVPYNPPSTHPFHTLDIWYPNPTDKALWAIFIHGGAWCDPTQTKTQGHAVLTHLLTRFPLLNAASIDYRLSPHPAHAAVGETVNHPAHLEDVQAALKFLNDTYQMRNYILIGHSAGATLCFQILGSGTPCTELLPKAVIGLAGIYDLRGLVEEYPDYRGFVEGAFG
ncbi:Alpha/Beta hydrolase protein, partial [Terfezia claveryi]